MPNPVYATLVDYRNWLDDQNAAASTALFARASEVIDEVLIGAVYPINDTTQMPTDAKHIEALRDATCAQVAWFDEIGDTAGSGGGGELGNIASASIGSVSFTKKDAASGGSQQKTRSGKSIAPGVISTLRVAGLTPTGVLTHG